MCCCKARLKLSSWSPVYHFRDIHLNYVEFDWQLEHQVSWDFNCFLSPLPLAAKYSAIYHSPNIIPLTLSTLRYRKKQKKSIEIWVVSQVELSGGQAHFSANTRAFPCRHHSSSVQCLYISSSWYNRSCETTE